MRFKIRPYKLGSQSAKALARGLCAKRISDSYEPKRKDVIINWGNSTPYAEWGAYDLNYPRAVAIACNKLDTFRKLQDEGFEHIPEWTTSTLDAMNLLISGETVYCRTSLTGHSGHGIIIAENTSQLVNAPLYTVKARHKYEFRVHVFNGMVLDVQQKKRRLDWDGGNTGIRNHSNGYIYARSEIAVPQVVIDSAIEAVEILGLDFAGVDVGYRERDSRAFVFEVNTAVGLVGTTLDKYVHAFNTYLREING